MDTLSVILTVLGIIVTIFLTVYALKVQGSYRKAKLNFYPFSVVGIRHVLKSRQAFNEFKKEVSTTPIITGYLDMLTGNKEFKVVLSHLMTVTNSGNLTAENITVKLVYPKAYSAEEFVDPHAYDLLSKLQHGIKRIHYSTVEDMCCSIFEISMIPPGESMEFYEYFLYDSTSKNKAKSKLEEKITNGTDQILKMCRVYYDVVGKNIASTNQGSFFFVYSSNESLTEFMKKSDPVVLKLAENYHPNYERAFKERYWLGWPYGFWFRVLYRNRMVKFIVMLKNLDHLGANEPNPKVLYEDFASTIYSYAISDYSPFRSVSKKLLKSISKIE